jgi:hypothetical protein
VPRCSLSLLACLSEVPLVWLPGHRGIFCNEEADELARQASAKPLHNPESALAIPKRLATEEIKSWTEYQHHSTWRDLPGHRCVKIYVGKTCKKIANVQMLLCWQ